MQIASRRIPGIENACARVRITAVSILAPLLAAVLLLAAVRAGHSQSSNHTVFAPPRVDLPTGFGVPTTNGAPIDAVTAERRREALRAKLQKQMETDSDKLLKLARELNDEVAAAGSSSLTSEQAETLGRIEKLARSVKKKMLDNEDQPSPAVSGPPVYSNPDR